MALGIPHAFAWTLQESVMLQQQHKTSLPRFLASRLIDLFVLIAAIAIGLPFFLVTVLPFLESF
jgi:hypothetical protein